MAQENEELRAITERYIRNIGNVTVEDIVARAEGAKLSMAEIKEECNRQAKSILEELKKTQERRSELQGEYYKLIALRTEFLR